MSGAADTPARSWRLPLAVRLAVRDLAGGMRGFRVFIACIFLGVAAITGIGSSARILADSLANEGQRILGGDVAFRIVHTQAGAREVTWMQSQGKVSSIATMRAMARNNAGSATLVEIKAVDSLYPLTGSIELSGAKAPLDQLLARKDGVYGLIGDQALLARLSLKIGDVFQVGDARYQFRAVLKSEPDKLADGFGLGPRVIVSQLAFRDSGLVRPGALVNWAYRILLAGGSDGSTAGDGRLQAVIADAEAKFPDAAWRVRTRKNVSPGFSRNLNRFAQFLTLVALTALVVGGVGVANAVRGFMDRKQKDLAILKSLGAGGDYIFRMSIVEVLLAAGIGIALGAIMGATIPFLVAWLFGPVIPIPFRPSVYPATLLTGAAFGVLTALAFALPPLGHVHDTRVSALFRDRVESERKRLRVRYIVMTACVVVLFLAVVIATASDRWLALVYMGVAAAALTVLRFFGTLVIAGARRAPHVRWMEARLAIANIHRPGSVTQALVLSLGLGMTLLVALSIMDLNFRSILKEGMPGKTPSFFFLDIQRSQVADFRAFIEAKAPGAKLDLAPMMRGRVIAVKGVPASKVSPPPNVAWALRGDRGITYEAAIPAGSVLTKGAWWKTDYSGEPLVSVEAEIGEGLGLKIGDPIMFNVLGRRITAKVANFREVNWRTFGINFVFVFSPNTFAGAPHANIATATFADGDQGKRELSLLAAIAQRFPTITSVRIRETLDALAKVSDQLSFAIRGATSIALLASILVLAGAVSAGQKARIYDAVVLKTLGATRRRLVLSILLEYGLLGVAAGAFSLLAGATAAWLILTRIMDFDGFEWRLLAGAQAVSIGLAITILLGLAGTWRILKGEAGPAFAQFITYFRRTFLQDRR